jgi:hypothetical protein
MCGIVGAPTLSLGAPLATLVKSRGTRSWSLTVLDLNTLTRIHTHQDGSVYDETQVANFMRETMLFLDSSINPYYIFHLQSPTAIDRKYHPAIYMGSNNTEHYLWHNGMIDSSEHRKYDRKWDTQILLESFIDGDGEPDFSKLSEFQGSFACYYLNSKKGLYAFRNRISPQYHYKGSFSSVSFDEAEKIEPGTVYSIPSYDVVATFENSYNPFGM